MTWWPGWVGGSLYIGGWVSVNTIFYSKIRAAAIGTHSGGNFSILVCADCRSQEYAIGEMPSPVFMKYFESGSGLWLELPHIWWTTLHKNMASNKTSNQTSENQDDNQWPRFLIMEAADQNVPLNLNGFVLKKAIDGMVNAELDNVKPMTAKTNQNAWIFKVTMLLYQEIVQNGKLRKTLWPSNIQRRFHSQMLANVYNPLQETLLTPRQTQTFKHFSAYYKSGIQGHGGVCILVKNKFIHS